MIQRYFRHLPATPRTTQTPTSVFIKIIAPVSKLRITGNRRQVSKQPYLTIVVFRFNIPSGTKISLLRYVSVYTHTGVYVYLCSTSRHQLLDTKTCVQSQASVCGICGGLRGTERGHTSASFYQYHSTDVPYSYSIHLPPTPHSLIKLLRRYL